MGPEHQFSTGDAAMSAKTVGQKCRNGESTTHIVAIPRRRGNSESWSLLEAGGRTFSLTLGQREPQFPNLG